MQQRIYQINPEVPRGYVLNRARGAFGIIVPEATRNYAANPSAERDLTNWSGTNATIARTTAWQRRGTYGISVTPTASTGTRGIDYAVTGVSLSTPTTVSLDFRGIAGLRYQLQIVTSGITYATPFYATGQDERLAVTAPQGLGLGVGTVSMLMLSEGVQPFYVDGLQVEPLDHATTYCDGDLTGFVRNQAHFYWTGTPHASASVRTADTRAGGRIVMLDSLGLTILSIIGLSLAPFAQIATPLATGGAFYQDTIPQTRDFTLAGDLYGVTEQQLEAQKAALLDAINPYVTPIPQPLVLMYEQYDQCGRQPISERCQLVAHVGEGWQGLRDNNHQERMACGFRMFLPMITRDGESGATLSPQQSIATTNILQRSRTGDWAAMGTGTNGTVRAIIADGAGGIYAAGSFTLAGGVANTVKIARWTGTAWAALGTGAAGGDVFALAIMPNGDLIAAGSFTSMGGAANTSRIARWTGSAWTNLGTGMNDTVFALAVAPNGYLYAGGNFTTAGGGAANYIAVWTGAVWSALGAGADSSVTALDITPDSTLYAGGDFTTIDGVTAARIAAYDGTTWTALADGLNSTVRAILVAPSGLVYAAGQFTASGSTALALIGAWNGTAWAPLGDGVGQASDLALDAAGNLYVDGQTIGLASPGYSMWTGTTWIPSEIAASGLDILALEFAPDGTFYAGGSFSSPATTADLSTITTTGTAPAAPTITITGSLSAASSTVYQLINTTTGAAIYFDELTIATGEVMTLTLDPTNISFISSFQGNILSRILPLSTLTGWQLRPGANTVSFYASDAGVTATIRWREQYVAIEHTVIR